MSAKGEKYTSKKAMKKHEKTEPMSAMVMEYGKKKAMKKASVKKVVMKKMGKKK